MNSTKFMESSLLSNVLNNPPAGIQKIKWKFDKKFETCRIKFKFCDCFLENTNFKDDLIEYKCLCCNKNYQRKKDFLIHIDFLIMISISVFYVSVFIYMNTWMTGKNPMKHHYLKNNIFTVTYIR